MRKQILPYEETRRNARLKELHASKKNNLLVSGTTGQLDNWNVEEIIKPNTIKNVVERLIQEDWDNTIGKKCNGLTYLEIEQLDNTFNNFR